jgi:hypothetical protein
MFSRLKTANDKRRNKGSQIVYVGSAKTSFDGYSMYYDKINTLKDLLKIHGYSVEQINDMIKHETKKRELRNYK